jgi:hypothetical protein
MAPGRVKAKHEPKKQPRAQGQRKKTAPPPRQQARPPKPEHAQAQARPAKPAKPAQPDGAAQSPGQPPGKRADPAPVLDAPDVALPEVTAPAVAPPLDPLVDEAGNKTGKSLRKFPSGPASP